MLKISAIRTFVAVLFLQTVLGCGVFLPLFGTATRCRWYPWFYIVRAEDGIHVYSDPEEQDEINAWFDSPSLIEMDRLTLYPLYQVGPIEGIIELYRRESLLSSPDDYRWQLFDIELTESELEFVHQELIIYASNDQGLSRYQPGAPMRIRFLPAQAVFSLIKVGTYFGFPAFITWLIGYFKTHTQEAITKSRRDFGLCIHCSYNCRGLPTPTCPECGNPHSIPLDSLRLNSHA